MVTLIVIVLVGFGVIGVTKLQERTRRDQAVTREQGRIQHRRTGEFPSSCSWCKNTALAKKLIIFDRSDGNWRASDLMTLLQNCPDTEVDKYADRMVTDQPPWRRFCTEKCTKEFFAAEHFAAMEAFASCEYCSARSPVALMRCPNCGATRK
jgi:hypothetical protein